MFGSEYYFNKVSSDETDDPFFHGGEAFASYLFTGEVAPVQREGRVLRGRVCRRDSVFDGGLGAWEVVLRFSYVDLDSGTIARRQVLARSRRSLNWYLSKNVRFELEYGYSVPDRDGLVGVTQYFQSRLQLSLM